mmetsp:Transcript_30454/g.70220  ORF Transcript_30454/g.70220 Transcript_30454/m.70220 type:complete len:343 (-) Transcript_30454:3728-4756(-)
MRGVRSIADAIIIFSVVFAFVQAQVHHIDEAPLPEDHATVKDMARWEQKAVTDIVKSIAPDYDDPEQHKTELDVASSSANDDSHRGPEGEPAADMDVHEDHDDHDDDDTDGDEHDDHGGDHDDDHEDHGDHDADEGDEGDHDEGHNEGDHDEGDHDEGHHDDHGDHDDEDAGDGDADLAADVAEQGKLWNQLTTMEKDADTMVSEASDQTGPKFQKAEDNLFVGALNALHDVDHIDAELEHDSHGGTDGDHAVHGGTHLVDSHVKAPELQPNHEPHEPTDTSYAHPSLVQSESNSWWVTAAVLSSGCVLASALLLWRFKRGGYRILGASGAAASDDEASYPL